MILQKKASSVSRIMGFLRGHRDILIKYQVKRIGLFGSYLYGQQSRASDIDFLVEFVKPTFDNYMGLLEFLEQGLDREVDLITRKSLSRYMLPQVRREVRWYETR